MASRSFFGLPRVRFCVIMPAGVIRLRMRKKPNLQPRMERCSRVLVAEPSALRGNWLVKRPDCTALELEIGCGKGGFTAATAASQPHVLLAAVERVPDALVVAMERVCAQELTNVLFLCEDARELENDFAPGEIRRIYINFCDPWPKSRDAKHRLTAPGFLRTYARLLPVGGELCFKTDNRPLFDWSLEQLTAEGWELREQCFDLHENGQVGIMTDYEAKFHSQGVKICRVVAVREQNTISSGDPGRLRNASLADAYANQREEQDP